MYVGKGIFHLEEYNLPIRWGGNGPIKEMFKHNINEQVIDIIYYVLAYVFFIICRYYGVFQK